MSVQPFGALLFTIFAVLWLTTTRFWRGDRTRLATAG